MRVHCGWNGKPPVTETETGVSRVHLGGGGGSVEEAEGSGGWVSALWRSYTSI